MMTENLKMVFMVLVFNKNEIRAGCYNSKKFIWTFYMNPLNPSILRHSFIQEAIPHLFNDIQKHETTILNLVKEAKKMDASAIAFSSLAMRNRTDFSAHIQENPRDYLFIHGVLDRLIEVEEYRIKTAPFPEQLCLIDGAGHMSPWENPTAVMNCIKSVL